MKRKASGPRGRLEVVVAGDRRAAEEVILEVRALAARYGLEIPNAAVVSQSAATAQVKKSTPRRRGSSPRSPTSIAKRGR